MLHVSVLNVIMLSVIFIVIPIVVTLNVILLSDDYAECHLYCHGECAECHYAKCNHAECHYVGCHYAKSPDVIIEGPRAFILVSQISCLFN
jgi:hypothetical protein